MRSFFKGLLNIAPILFFVLMLVIVLWDVMSTSVRLVSPESISFDDKGNEYKVPYYGNFRLGQPKESILHGIVVIHGTHRNAYTYYHTMKKALEMRSEFQGSTVMIVPQFLIEEDIDAHELDSHYVFWSKSGWKSGSRSISTNENQRHFRISSYAVLDRILESFVGSYPNLKSLVITGHSAGGQFVQRYAAVSPMISTLSDTNSIEVTTIAANSSSYVYLNNERLVDETNDQFDIPNVDNCDTYNDWKYGLDNKYSYAAGVTAEQVREWYQQRNIVYLLGSEDNKPNSRTLDKSCQAMLQGKHRLQRAEIFYNYLMHFYGESIRENHIKEIVFGVGHNHKNIYHSEIGLYHLFNQVRQHK